MSERTCDLCGWPIEEWQKVSGGYEDWAQPPVLRHANPADHRPTRKPEPETPTSFSMKTGYPF